jgi:hypothetical protein
MASPTGRHILDGQNIHNRSFASAHGRENVRASVCVGVAPAGRRISGSGQFGFKKFRKEVVVSNLHEIVASNYVKLRSEISLSRFPHGTAQSGVQKGHNKA